MKLFHVFTFNEEESSILYDKFSHNEITTDTILCKAIFEGLEHNNEKEEVNTKLFPSSTGKYYIAFDPFTGLCDIWEK